MSRRPLYTSDDDSPQRDSLGSRSSFDLTIEDPESHPLYTPAYTSKRSAFPFTHLLSSLWRSISSPWTLIRAGKRERRTGKTASSRRSWPHRSWLLLQTLLVCAFLLAVFVAVAYPSYCNPPARYQELRRRSEASSKPGRANLGEEKVFIAASIFDRDGSLATGAWGESLLELVDLLGPANVFLSIYENDAGDVAKAALKKLEERIPCEKAIVFEDHVDIQSIAHVQLPDGSQRVKRIAYLAEVRNRALRPLALSATRYHKLFYLNDVVFDPVSAVQLLFATNAESGTAEYRAACSMDFVNPIKFYDTFASRDLEGYSMGLPIYPWFSSAGKAESRQDVYDQKDAVRVKSCWGGMVAFDAKFFQSTPSDFDDLETASTIVPDANFTGYRFRAEEELFWEAAECCLIHADIQQPDDNEPGIYMNPYIRVAYGAWNLSWLQWSRRVERIYSPFQYAVNAIIGLPWFNPRRGEQAWREVQHQVWTPDANNPSGGSFKMVDQIASNAGFCGIRVLQVLKEKTQPGGKNWEFIPVPAV